MLVGPQIHPRPSSASVPALLGGDVVLADEQVEVIGLAWTPTCGSQGRRPHKCACTRLAFGRRGSVSPTSNVDVVGALDEARLDKRRAVLDKRARAVEHHERLRHDTRQRPASAKRANGGGIV